MNRIRTLDIVVLTLVVLLVASLLAPAVARLQRSPGDAQCQSNLRRWSNAMALYLGENNRRYPTNRMVSLPRPLNGCIQLTPDGQTQNGSPRRFQYGVNWVEALYPYIWAAAARTGQDWRSFRKCPNARDMLQIPNGPFAWSSYITYAFNYNLVELPDSMLRRPGSLMMIREMDRRVNSLLRPANVSTNATVTPGCPFLTTTDSYNMQPPATLPNQHSTGSYIVFADGHVRYFTTDFYPVTPVWDSDTQQWYNFVYPNPANDTERMLNRSIAITP